ncbi:MAG TPA: sulfite exporter TauE/SafE family protein [Methylomusa anaerophila]|uniref:Probable membrane transporter protein n=1 Tax=Methylomusa anaerophila TaxID=1930071 RepID=A0A348AQP6_9FIRM|nr:sulfite exporter TauE/SafE family protein [Methylomusa anaerophila]BBB93394.1 hypothetical protein MAMMFC1_04111 [Methylomusa anaerophila]HML90342.1 sulfite exporter TauE/SafE family protein [Methylomusa anaerophila]
MLLTLLLFLLGLSVGAVGTLIGVGGGFILVPVFLLALHYSPQHAVGTSLAIVLLNAVSGTISYIKQKKVYYDAAIRFSLATLPGAVLGSYTAHNFTSRGFYISFGIFLITISILLYLQSKHKPEPSASDLIPFEYNRLLGTLLSVLVGFLSSTFGIGGGIVHVPAMIGLLGFPTHIATATSHFVLAVSAFFGVISHYLLGNILTVPALVIGSGAVFGAQLGAYIAPKTKSQSIRLLLCLALFILGMRMMVGQ